MTDIEFKKKINQDIKQYTNNLKGLRKVSDLCQTQLNDLEIIYQEKAFPALEDIFIRHNLHTLITISTLDLLTSIKLIYSAKQFWVKIHLLKTGYLTVYETILAFEKRKLKVRQLIILHNADLIKFDKISFEIKTFKKTYDFTKIGKIRNKTAGHINDNFEDYYDTIVDINVIDGVTAFHSLLEILLLLNDYLEYLRNVINKNFEEEKEKLEIEVDILISKLNKDR